MMKENYKDTFKFIGTIAISLFLLIPISYVSIMLALIYFLGILIFWGYCFYQIKEFKWYLITVIIIIGGFFGYMEYDNYQKEQARVERHLIEEPIKYQETLQILNKKFPDIIKVEDYKKAEENLYFIEDTNKFPNATILKYYVEAKIEDIESTDINIIRYQNVKDILSNIPDDYSGDLAEEILSYKRYVSDKYDEAIQTRLAIDKEEREQKANTLAIGDSAWKIRTIYGEPEQVNSVETKYGLSEQYVYPNGLYIYVVDGSIVAIQNYK